MDEIEEVKTLSDLEQFSQPMGPRITLAREQMGLSIDEVAASLGVTPASVGAWENDERTPRANRLLMLAGVLNVSLTWLLEGREDQRMAAGGSVSIGDVRSRIEAARNLFAEGMTLLESAESALATLADDEDPDPSEVED